MRFKKIYLEITTNCNKRCKFCGGTTRKSEFISVENFEYRLLQIKGLGERIYLHVAGEPLLHPNLADFLRIAEQNNISIGIVTNGLLLEKQQNILLSPALHELNISLHSAENSDEFEKIINSALNLWNLRSDNLILNFRIWNGETAKQSLEKLYEILREKFNKNLQILHEFKSANKHKITENLFVHFDFPFSWNKNAASQKNGFCYGLQSHFAILCDGSVVPCCLCKNGEIVLGNINEKSITQILSNPKTKAIVGGFTRRILVDEVCQRCEFARQKFNNKFCQ